MPSIRKRIGYLPSSNIQEIITRIAKKEKLSQSKVVGELVEEALIARGEVDLQNTTNLFKNTHYSNEINKKNSSFKYNDLDELISDQGITYNTNKYKNIPDTIPSKLREETNDELFEQFKQFMMFQKMIQEKK